MCTRYERGGLNLLLRTMERRARQPGCKSLCDCKPDRRKMLAGNVASLEPVCWTMKADALALSL